MEKTGERYNAARRVLIDHASNGQRVWADQPEMTETAVTEATGRGWNEWSDIIEAWPGNSDGHSAIAAFLHEEHNVDSWWAQSVTVGYERITGLRVKYQAAACGGTDDAGSTTTPLDQTTVAGEPSEGPAMGPADVVFEDQASDGSTITIASVTLPAAGFIAVHADADGGPGDVIGHSELLQAGTTENVVVTFDAPLAQLEVVWPMAHIDVDEDGVYTFVPPDNVVDGPATFADGSVAVVSGEVTLGG